MDDIDLEPLIENYCRILFPLFQCTGDAFDYVLALLRATGHANSGWDTLTESHRVLDDLYHLSAAELPIEYFPESENTRLRLSLLAYCHLVEMDAPYEILANLCRVKLGMPVSTNPFRSVKKRHSIRNAQKSTQEAKLLHPAQKIESIKTLTKQAGLEGIGTAFDDFYRSGIRNAISHSDYIIYHDELRLRNQTVPTDDGTKSRTSVVSLPRLNELINYARAFHLAFIRIEKGARLAVGKNGGKAYIYDEQYKGLLEVVADANGFLCGAAIHWPNNTESSYFRTDIGSRSMNIIPMDGGLETFVGQKHSPHDAFSPLLAPGEEPHYSPLSGSDEVLKWPEAGKK